MKRGGDVAVPWLERIVLVARRPEQGHHLVLAVRGHAEQSLGDAKILVLGTKDRSKRLAKGGGISISRKPHGLRGVVVREAEVAGEHFPQEAHRMRIVENLDFLDVGACGFRKRGAGGLANSVDGENRGAIEAGWKIGRGGMRQVVGNEMEFLAKRASEQFIDRRGHLTDSQTESFLELRIPKFRSI